MYEILNKAETERALLALLHSFIEDLPSGTDDFIRYFQPLVEGGVRHILPSQYDIEQVVTDVFFKLWKGRNRLPQNETVLYYILAVTRRTAIDHYRKEKTQVRHLPLESISGSFQAEQPPGLHLELLDFLDVLPRESRELFLAYYWYGYTAKELSVRYLLPIPTVYTRLYRAKKVLQTLHRKEESKL